MLVSLHVKNLALIDEQEVFFEQGLNILTGETGAGKSVIVGSVNLALGAKADKELIRTGAEYALIELVFQVDERQREALEKLDIFPEEDGTLVIQRKIMAARSVCRVCGETAGARQLREIAEQLIDIHGQHEHQSLLEKKKHGEILDGYAQAELSGIKDDLREEYREYRELKQELDQTDTDEVTREKEAALLRFELEEIRAAAPVSGEDEELDKSYRKMANARKIQEALSYCCRLTGGESEEGAAGNIGRALRELKSVEDYDAELTELYRLLSDADGLLHDFNRAAADYVTGLDFDAESFAGIEERLNLLNHLKTKYGKTIDEILAYEAAGEERLNVLEDYEAYRAGLTGRFRKAQEKLRGLCEKASVIRKKQAGRLGESLRKALLDLNFEEVRFEIQVRQEPGQMSADGYDEVEFMISTNKGEELRPLSHVASGGELSRIMLAFKTVLADKDDIHTLIFDEIDTGISGRTAWKVSEKLGILGKEHQVICITHLPQIAAMADSHFLIEKGTSEGRTVTNIKKLEDEDSLRELARMLGGASITDAALQNAKEMKDLAANTKQY